MNIQTTQNGGLVTLTLRGRLDTAASREASTDIDRELNRLGQIASLTCNVRELDYISSSGLRILLGLAKRFRDFRIVEAQPEVYQVLDVTGFTKIMKVEKALREMSIAGCEVIGRGGVGTVYRIDEDTIIKVFRAGTTEAEVQTEIQMAKEAFVLGMPTAISFDVVRVGTQLGLVYELLRAETLSACIRREPQHIETFAKTYADLFRQLHSISVPATSNIPNAQVSEQQAILRISHYFPAQGIDLLLRIAEAIPKADRMLHCDLQTKNAMIQDSEPMLIDLGEMGYGHPLLDLGHACSAMTSLVGDYEQIVGLPERMAREVYDKMLAYYFEGLSPAELSHRREQIEAVATIRGFSWLALSDSFPPELVRQCQELFQRRVLNKKDRLLAVAQTFSDWTI